MVFVLYHMTNLDVIKDMSIICTTPFFCKEPGPVHVLPMGSVHSETLENWCTKYRLEHYKLWP